MCKAEKGQKKIYKPDEIEEELKVRDINILEDDYILNKEFLEFEKEYVIDQRVMQASWWIEKNLVGQRRLKKIYGIYAMGVEHEYSDDELKDSVWMTDLADKYKESKIKKKDFARTVKDVEQYFKRKDNKSGEVGLIERLKKLGIDINKFEGPKAKEQRVKLLYFLYGVEFKNQAKLSVFLSNPSLENVDNRIVGDITRNGELMAYLKNNVEKECDGSYVAEVKRTLYIIADEWEKEIHCVKSKVLPGTDTGWFSRISDDLAWLLGKSDETPGVYMDSLMETFYLKLSLHEMIGRERDMIRTNSAEYKETGEPNEFQKKM